MDVVDACLAVVCLPFGLRLLHENCGATTDRCVFSWASTGMCSVVTAWICIRRGAVRWLGRRRAVAHVVRELEAAEEQTKKHHRMTLAMCVNYGGRAELVAPPVSRPPRRRRAAASGADHREDVPPVPGSAGHAGRDLFLRPRGEAHLEFLPWHSAYEMLLPGTSCSRFHSARSFDAVLEYASP